MRLVIIDDTIEKCRKGEEAGITSGDVMGRILEMEEHIHVASLAVSASTQNGSYQRIGQWKVCKSVDSAAPANGKGVEIFLGAEDNTLLAFYKGCQVEDVHVVNYRTDFTARIQGIVDCEALSQKRVLMIGCGSAGSKMAMDLTRAGVGGFTLVDFDRVEGPNLCRCEYFTDDMGRYKTLALRERILSVNPGAQVETLQQNVMEISDESLIGLMQESDLVVSAADDPAAEQRLNALAHSLIPVVYPALYSRAAAGEIIFTLPGGPCYQCVVGTLRSAQDAPAKGEWDYTTAGDLKAEPGLGIDIDHVVTIASKIALGLLMKDTEGSEIAGLIDTRRTMVIVSNQRQEMYRISFEAFGIAWVDTEVNKGCEICQRREGDKGALLSEVRKRIAQAASVGFCIAGNASGNGEES